MVSQQWSPRPDHRKEFYEDLGLLEIRVTQNQIQPTPTYVLPVDIDIYTGDQVERHRIIIDKRDQTFTFEMGAAPDAVILMQRISYWRRSLKKAIRRMVIPVSPQSDVSGSFEGIVQSGIPAGLQ